MLKPRVIVAEGGRSRKRTRQRAVANSFAAHARQGYALPLDDWSFRGHAQKKAPGTQRLAAHRAAQTVFLLIYGSLVSFSSTILNKLNEKRSEGDQEHDVDQAAFVQ